MKKLLILSLVLTLVSCGKNNGNDDDGGTYSPEDTDMVMSALGVISSSLNDQEQINQLALLDRSPAKSFWELILPSAYASNECNRGRFSPYIGPSSTCIGTGDNKTVMVNYNGCNPGGYDYLSLYGSVKLYFDTPGTCNEWVNGDVLPISGSVVRTTSNYQRVSGGRLVVSMDSNDHENYNKTLVGGGVITAFTPSYRQVHILGITRIGKWNGKVVFNHSVSTPSPLFVTGNKEDNNRLIASGGIQIDDNLKGYSLNASLSNLPFVSNCCYPVGGGLSFTRSGSRNGSVIVNFSSSCGQISGTIDDQPFTSTLRSCE